MQSAWSSGSEDILPCDPEIDILCSAIDQCTLEKGEQREFLSDVCFIQVTQPVDSHQREQIHGRHSHGVGYSWLGQPCKRSLSKQVS